MGICDNISPNGIFIITPNAHKTKKILLNLQLPQKQINKVIDGQIIRQDKNGIAIKFNQNQINLINVINSLPDIPFEN